MMKKAIWPKQSLNQLKSDWFVLAVLVKIINTAQWLSSENWCLGLKNKQLQGNEKWRIKQVVEIVTDSTPQKQ